MRAPAFWWRPPALAAMLLAPIGWIYGAVTARRMVRAGARAGVPVICVGNFVAGGAGKTPTAIAIAGRLAADGRRPVFLSRGYGGTLAGPIRVDPAVHRAQDCGDEPLLLARAAPTVVARDRLAGARLAATLGDVIVMDDGLQNPTLHKDVTIAVVDGESGVGNGLCCPAGPLRAPLRDQLRHVDVVIVIGPGQAGDAVARTAGEAGLGGKPTRVLRAKLSPDPDAADRLAGRAVLAFAGIGRPEKFWRTLAHIGVRVAACRPFPDHHPYTRTEIESLLHDARRQGLTLVTTEKDWVRVARVTAPDDVPAIAVLPVSLAWQDEAGLQSMLAQISGCGQS